MSSVSALWRCPTKSPPADKTSSKQLNLERALDYIILPWRSLITSYFFCSLYFNASNKERAVTDWGFKELHATSLTRIRDTLKNLTFMWPCIVTNFFIIKPTRCTNFTNLFWRKTVHVSDSSSVHHQKFFTVHSAMVYVMQFCRQIPSRTRMVLFRELSTNMYEDNSSVHHQEFFRK